MYRERMLEYYPNVIKSILEFNAIIDTESADVEDLYTNREQILSDAYLPTMSERRILQWEKYFGIQPLELATLEDRRNNIIARIRGQGKLNTNLINTIVKTFTGESCKCWIEDSTLFVGLLPFDETKVSIADAISNITAELSLKIPSHLGLNIDISYLHWEDVNTNNTNWALVNATHGTWEDVKLGRVGKANMLDSSKLDEFYLG